MSEKEFQEKYIEYQVLSNQLKQLQQQMSNLDQHILELNTLLDSLNKLSEEDEERETLIPVGAGVFLEGKLNKVKDAIVTVGANIAVKKSLEDTKKLIKNQIEEVKNIIKDTEMQAENVNSHLMKIQEEISKK